MIDKLPWYPKIELVFKLPFVLLIILLLIIEDYHNNITNIKCISKIIFKCLAKHPFNDNWIIKSRITWELIDIKHLQHTNKCLLRKQLIDPN